MSNTPPSSEHYVLELRNIYKEYRQVVTSVTVLQNFSLQLAKGELLAITGASGSGKSTLLHIAGLLDTPDSGEIIIDGQIITRANEDLKEKTRLHKIGFVYQYHHLLRDFTAIENVALPRLIAGENYEKALEDAEILLEKLDLKHRLHNLPGELSGGQQQRVAIARALINRPRLILADEPTGNLDPLSARNALDLLINLAKTANMAVIIVTHNHQIAELVDRVIDISALN